MRKGDGLQFVEKSSERNIEGFVDCGCFIGGFEKGVIVQEAWVTVFILKVVVVTPAVLLRALYFV